MVKPPKKTRFAPWTGETLYWCNKCPPLGQFRPRGAFYKSKLTGSGLASECKECQRRRRKKYKGYINPNRVVSKAFLKRRIVQLEVRIRGLCHRVRELQRGP